MVPYAMTTPTLVYHHDTIQIMMPGHGMRPETSGIKSLASSFDRVCQIECHLEYAQLFSLISIVPAIHLLSDGKFCHQLHVGMHELLIASKTIN